MIFTDEQKLIINLFESIASDEDEYIENRIYILDAPAGTGKTTLIKEIDGIVGYYEHQVRILCPTHKSKSLFDNADTIHSFLGADIKYDNESGNATYPFGVPHEEDQIFLLIIDEASMVSSDMLKILLQTQKEYRFNILFVCDRCQIPPIGEDISPIFKIKNARQLSLTRNMRSEISKDSNSVSEYRKYTNDPSIKPGVEMLTKITKNKMVKLFSTTLENGKDQDCIVLVYTNAKRMKWNTYIRSILFKEQPEIEPYYIGEKLIFTGRREGNNTNGIYNTSDIIEIIDLIKVKNHITRSTTAGKACADYEFLELSFYQITDQRGTLWFIVLDEDKEKLNDFFNRYKKAIINLDGNKRGRYWKGFYEVYNMYFPNLDYSYASTVHKAQGSQWKNVIVDFGNLMQCRDKLLRNKLVYTAVSRMTDFVYYTI